jgi:hypothetical protein
MSHPGNKRERFLIGDRKGQRRVVGHCIYKTKGDRQEYLNTASKRRRNTTKLCSCFLCEKPVKKQVLISTNKGYEYEGEKGLFRHKR